jgi:hypothetical protein
MSDEEKLKFREEWRRRCGRMHQKDEASNQWNFSLPVRKKECCCFIEKGYKNF